MIRFTKLVTTLAIIIFIEHSIGAGIVLCLDNNGHAKIENNLTVCQCSIKQIDYENTIISKSILESCVDCDDFNISHVITQQLESFKAPIETMGFKSIFLIQQLEKELVSNTFLNFPLTFLTSTLTSKKTIVFLN